MRGHRSAARHSRPRWVGVLDLAAPVIEDETGTPPPTVAQPTHEVQPPPESDHTVAEIAAALVTAYAAAKVAQLLSPFGITAAAVNAALKISSRGTNASPNARHAEHGSTLSGGVRTTRDKEIFFRAAYVASAARRIQTSLSSGKTLREAVKAEKRNFVLHEHARRGRLNAQSRVQAAAQVYGWPHTFPNGSTKTLLGWSLNPLLNNEAECIAANGHNFWAEDGTIIGYPGSVHLNCGCYPCTPWPGGVDNMANDHLREVVRFTKTPPTFKQSKK